MCGASADGGGEAKGAGAEVAVVDGGAESDFEVEECDWGCGGLEGVVLWVGGYCFKGSAFYGYTVSAVGVYEGLEEEEDGEGDGGGERGVWEY